MIVDQFSKNEVLRKKSSPSVKPVLRPARREKTIGFVLKSEAKE